MSWADAVTREAAWFTSDPPPGGSFNTAPPLLLANGGRFDIVQGNLQKYSPASRALYIYRTGRMKEERISFGGVKVQSHHFVALIQWPYRGGPSGSGKLEDEVNARDLAVDDVLTRIRGPLGDHSHNGQFWSVAETDGDIEIDIEDDYANVRERLPLVVRIHYTASDSLVG